MSGRGQTGPARLERATSGSPNVPESTRLPTKAASLFMEFAGGQNEGTANVTLHAQRRPGNGFRYSRRAARCALQILMAAQERQLSVVIYQLTYLAEA